MVRDIAACVLGALLALTVGCPDVPGDDDTNPDDDDLGDDDTLPADDDDDTGGAFKPEPNGGSALMWFTDQADGQGGVIAYAGFVAQFASKDEPIGDDDDDDDTGDEEFVWEMPEGVDDCAVTVYAASDLPTGGEPAPMNFHTVGTLTIAGPTGTFHMEPEQQGDGFVFQMELAADQQVEPGSHWDVSATGGDLSSFAEDKLMQLPDRVGLTLPDPSQPLALAGDLELAWEGLDPGELIWIELRDLHDGDEDNALLYCQAADDGAFTIPAEYTDALPDQDLQLTVLRGHTGYLYLPVEDLWISFGSSTTAVVHGNRI